MTGGVDQGTRAYAAGGRFSNSITGSRERGANLFFVNDVAYKKAAIQEMERLMIPASMKKGSQVSTCCKTSGQHHRTSSITFSTFSPLVGRTL
jgi:hypothetical protein